VCGFAFLASGCGSSGPGDSGAAGTEASGKPKQEDFFRYEGTGASKKKVMATRRERVKILREAREKSE
jgi:hypothetical protein